MTVVVNLRKDRYDVYIGRGSMFGNPFPMRCEEERDKVIEQYKVYFYKRIASDEEFKKGVLALKGKILGCYCKPKKCHGDIIVEYLGG